MSNYAKASIFFWIGILTFAVGIGLLLGWKWAFDEIELGAVGIALFLTDRVYFPVILIIAGWFVAGLPMFIDSLPIAGSGGGTYEVTWSDGSKTTETASPNFWVELVKAIIKSITCTIKTFAYLFGGAVDFKKFFFVINCIVLISAYLIFGIVRTAGDNAHNIANGIIRNDTYYYMKNEEGNGIIIVDYLNNAYLSKKHDHVIASEIDGLPVVGIDVAFSKIRSINQLTVPECITYLEEQAFARSKFTSVILPDGLTDIGTSAFTRCEKLKSIKIPKNVKRIGDYAFSGCKALTDVIIQPGHKIRYVAYKEEPYKGEESNYTYLENMNLYIRDLFIAEEGNRYLEPPFNYCYSLTDASKQAIWNSGYKGELFTKEEWDAKYKIETKSERKARERAEQTAVLSKHGDMDSALNYIVKSKYTSAKVRAEPAENAAELINIQPGDFFSVFEKNGKYFGVEYKGQSGYVLRSYVKKLTDKNRFAVLKVSQGFYDEPNKNSKHEWLDYDTKVFLLGENVNDYIKVMYNDRVGWIHKYYLKW